MLKRAAPRYVTIAIIPHGAEATQAVRLPHPVLRGLVVAAALVLAGLVWFSSAYLDSLAELAALDKRLSLQRQAYRDLERSYLEGQARYRELAATAQAIERRLQQLATESADLRKMLAQADSVPPPRPAPRPVVAGPTTSAGRGGPTSEAELLSAVSTSFKYVDDQLRLYSDHLEELRVRTLEFIRRRAHTPSIWPAEGWLSSGFGPRRHPVTGLPDFHYGVDIAGITGMPVLAAADGTVAMAGRRGSYGLAIVIDHGYGLRTLYAHLARIRVRAGQKVTKGQVIGAMGNTGLSTGPHLHYEVHVNGRPVNPYNYLP